MLYINLRRDTRKPRPSVLFDYRVHRLSQAQVPAILNHARALPQRDGASIV